MDFQPDSEILGRVDLLRKSGEAMNYWGQRLDGGELLQIMHPVFLFFYSFLSYLFLALTCDFLCLWDINNYETNRGLKSLHNGTRFLAMLPPSLKRTHDPLDGDT